MSNSPFHALEQWESASVPSTLRPTGQSAFWGEDGFNFEDVMDVVNPLQHVPVASGEYREASGDSISDGAKLVGGVLFGVLSGGVLGLGAALVNAAVRHDTGKDLPEHALALVKGETAGEAADPLPANAGISEALADLLPGTAADSPDELQPPGPPAPFPDSLHPAERLLAVRSDSGEVPMTDSSEGGPREAGSNSVLSTKRKVSEAYGERSADRYGEFWWEV